MSRPDAPSVHALRRAAPPDVCERGEEYFADGRVGLAITVCHLPPGTSKWNKIEHRRTSA